MFVIGTAGHVDHGKSTLIEAITGTHPDRLAEERDREMSIVLGFDTFQLPDGKEVSVVDVPGHLDFIENMLSGIGGIDAALLVIAADEGVMPQTREHLAILDLLEVSSAVIAVTKIDLVDDPEWLDLVELEIRETLQNTALKDAPLVRVSAKTGSGLDRLLQALTEVLQEKSPREDLGRPRLSIDRAFHVSGFGSVVTGTLLDGSFQVGDEISILPEGLPGRIRGLQNHNQDVESIPPGSRAAVNISGVDVEDIQRGDVVTIPHHYRNTRRLDVRFRYLPDRKQPLEHNSEAKLFLGADETVARVRVLGSEKIVPGEIGWLQLETEEPVVSQRGDHYILRRPSPSETLGGGIVIDPHPGKRHRRFDSSVLEHLKVLSQDKPARVLRHLLRKAGVISRSELQIQSAIPETNFQEGLQEILTEGTALQVGQKGGDQILADKAVWEDYQADILERVQDYHKQFPLRQGMAREELKSKSGKQGAVFEVVLEALITSQQVLQEGPLLFDADHRVEFSEEEEQLAAELLKRFSQNPHSPPTTSEAKDLVGSEIFHALVGKGTLIPVSPEVVFLSDTYQSMTAEIRKFIQDQGSITVAQARDLFGSTRRYMLAFLEDLDEQGVTVRDGDQRRLL